MNNYQKAIENSNIVSKTDINGIITFVNDEYGLLSTEFNVKAFPTTFIYDKNKNLKFTEVGYTSTFGLKLRLWWSSF